MDSREVLRAATGFRGFEDFDGFCLSFLGGAEVFPSSTTIVPVIRWRSLAGRHLLSTRYMYSYEYRYILVLYK